MATSSLVPSTRTPTMTRQHSRSSSRRTLKCTPSAHTYTKSRSDRSRSAKARCSSCHWVVSRVITDADSPAAEPKNPASAGAKSPLDMPCRYISGSTSVTFGLLRHHGGTIELRNRHRSPVSSSTRLSFTRGAVDLDRPRRRGDRARLGVPVAHHQPPAPLVTLAGQRRRCTRPPRPPARPPASGGRPPGTISSSADAHLRAALVVGHYSQHRRSFLAGVPAPAELVLVQRGRYVAPSNGSPIHRSVRRRSGGRIVMVRSGRGGLLGTRCGPGIGIASAYKADAGATRKRMTVSKISRHAKMRVPLRLRTATGWQPVEHDHAAAGPAHLAARPRDRLRIVELELGDARQPGLQRHPQLEAGEVGAGAAVDAGAERDVAVVLRSRITSSGWSNWPGRGSRPGTPSAPGRRRASGSPGTRCRGRRCGPW